MASDENGESAHGSPLASGVAVVFIGAQLEKDQHSMALWVFGYGSLLVEPGVRTCGDGERAVLKDYHRSFCMLSIHHRGTVEQSGSGAGAGRGGLAGNAPASRFR